MFDFGRSWSLSGHERPFRGEIPNDPLAGLRNAPGRSMLVNRARGPYRASSQFLPQSLPPHRMWRPSCPHPPRMSYRVACLSSENVHCRWSRMPLIWRNTGASCSWGNFGGSVSVLRHAALKEYCLQVQLATVGRGLLPISGRTNGAFVRPHGHIAKHKSERVFAFFPKASAIGFFDVGCKSSGADAPWVVVGCGDMLLGDGPVARLWARRRWTGMWRHSRRFRKLQPNSAEMRPMLTQFGRCCSMLTEIVDFGRCSLAAFDRSEADLGQICRVRAN